ncbi:MAG: hypothetical protein J0M12_01485 [Deltaproteobacteria bacterium]|nr:hypothetical protein [Deltaproteobacteria bacterium]
MTTNDTSVPPQETLTEVDQALSAQSIDPETEQDRRQAGKMHLLSSVLRKVALVLILTAAGTFLFQGWAGWNSVERIFAFLGFTASLAATGAICGLRYKDSKGARVSLGITAAVIPVAFSQTGGLLYSLFESGTHYVPEVLRFTAPSLSAALLTVAAVVALLTPISFIAFSALGRVEAKLLTALYIAGNLSLLLPTRDPTLIGLTAMLLIALTLFIDVMQFHRHPELRTFEGGLSRILMHVPFAILVVRNLALYSVSTILISCLFTVTAAFLFVVVPQISTDRRLSRLCQAMSTVPAAIAWATFANALFFEQGALLPLPVEYEIPLRALPVSIILVLMSFFTLGTATAYRKTAAFVAVGAMGMQLLTVPGVVSAFFCIVTSTVCIGSGCVMEEKGLFHAGCVGLLLGVLYHLRYAIGFFGGLGPWVSLAIFGIAILLLSSYLEKNYRPLLQKLSLLKQNFDSWA